MHEILPHGAVVLVIVPAGRAVHLFPLRLLQTLAAADGVCEIPRPDRDRKLDGDERHDRCRLDARRGEEQERLVRRRQKDGEHGARADEFFIVQFCRHHRKAALRDHARGGAEQRRQPAAQHVAVIQVGSAFQKFDEHIHQEQERKYFQAVQQCIEQHVSHIVLPPRIIFAPTKKHPSRRKLRPL